MAFTHLTFAYVMSYALRATTHLLSLSVRFEVLLFVA